MTKTEATLGLKNQTKWKLTQLNTDNEFFLRIRVKQTDIDIPEGVMGIILEFLEFSDRAKCRLWCKDMYNLITIKHRIIFRNAFFGMNDERGRYCPFYLKFPVAKHVPDGVDYYQLWIDVNNRYLKMKQVCNKINGRIIGRSLIQISLFNHPLYLTLPFDLVAVLTLIVSNIELTHPFVIQHDPKEVQNTLVCCDPIPGNRPHRFYTFTKCSIFNEALAVDDDGIVYKISIVKNTYQKFFSSILNMLRNEVDESPINTKPPSHSLICQILNSNPYYQT